MEPVRFAPATLRRSPEPSARSPRTFDTIDTPQRAAMTPLLDPALLSLLVSTNGNQNCHVTGTVQEDGASAPFDLQVQVQSSGNISGQIQGTWAGQSVAVSLAQSGLSLTEKGSIGTNSVDLTNDYNIFTGQVSTHGNLGQVQVSTTSHTNPLTVSGNLNSTPVSVTLQNGVLSGTLGTDSISGAISQVDANTQTEKEQIGTYALTETIAKA